MAFQFGFNPENLPVQVTGLDYRSYNERFSATLMNIVAKDALDEAKCFEANTRAKKQALDSAHKRKYSAREDDTEKHRLDAAAARANKNDDKLLGVGHSLLNPHHNGLCYFVNQRTARCKNIALGPVPDNDMFDDDDHDNVFVFCKKHLNEDLVYAATRQKQNSVINKAFRLAEADVIHGPAPAPVAPVPAHAAAAPAAQEATSDGSALDGSEAESISDAEPAVAPAVVPAVDAPRKRGRPAKIKEQAGVVVSFDSSDLEEVLDEMNLSK